MGYFFIGDAELLSAFHLIGVGGVAASNAEETREVFLKITRGWNETAGTVLPEAIPGAGDYRVLILTEEAADWLGSDLTDWQLSGRYPLVVEIPGIMGRLEGRKTLVDSIREAIGIHV
ncbi:MAG: ATPase V [Treponema sp.]|jgi:V/A-type H+-transporting ATPase subunit F|nr:ATPase V [Treponema sp.]